MLAIPVVVVPEVFQKIVDIVGTMLKKVSRTGQLVPGSLNSMCEWCTFTC